VTISIIGGRNWSTRGKPLFKIRKSNYCRKKGKFRVTSRILQKGVKFPHCDEKQGRLIRIFAHKVP
jgi:hypothetical protein